MLSDDGALTTTLVGILAERELEPTAARGDRVRARDPRGHGLADLSGRDPARRRRARLVPAPRSPPGRRRALPPHAARRSASGRSSTRSSAGSRRTRRAASRCSSAASWPEYVDGVSNLAHKILDVTDARGLVVPRRDGGAGRLGRADAGGRARRAGVARALGGGGHPQAASALFRGSLAEARERSRRRSRRGAARSRRARSCRGRRASWPPTTRSRTRWCSASGTARAGCSSATEALAGVVTREDLDKAIGHGLSHAPVKSVMTSSVVTCDEDDAARRAAAPACFDRRGPGARAPRRRGRRRRDAQRPPAAFGEAAEAPSRAWRRAIAERLRRSPSARTVFEAIQAVSGGYDGVYLVGGAVRDVLMGEPSFDLDVAVEGDGIAFGRALADALGGRGAAREVRDGDRVVLPEGAGRRRYDADRVLRLPGGAAAVEQASIRQDLFRRDFTINAMAVAPEGRGLRAPRRPVRRRLPTSSAGSSASSTTSRSSTTRRGSSGRSATRTGTASRWTRTRSRSRGRAWRWTSSASSSARLRDELQALLSEDEIGDSIRACTSSASTARSTRISRRTRRRAADRRGRRVRDAYAPGGAALAPAARRARAAAAARRALRLVRAPEAPPARCRPDRRRGHGRAAAPRARRGDRRAAAIRALVAPHDPDGALLALAA